MKTQPIVIQLALLILCSLFSGMGCAPSIREALNSDTLLKPISKTSTIQVDVEASEIIWHHPVNVAEFRPRRLRREIANSLEEAMNGNQGADVNSGYEPARFLLEVHGVDGSYILWLAPCVVYFTIFGCPTHSLHADITLTVEYQDKVYSTSTQGSATFNIYSKHFMSTSEISPVADAMRRAIRRLAKQMRRSTTSRSPSRSFQVASILNLSPVAQGER